MLDLVSDQYNKGWGGGAGGFPAGRSGSCITNSICIEEWTSKTLINSVKNSNLVSLPSKG